MAPKALVVSAGLRAAPSAPSGFVAVAVSQPARHLFRADLSAQPPASYKRAVVSSVGPSVLDQAALTGIAAALAPGGEVEVRELTWKVPSNATAPRAQELRDADGLKRALLFAGLTVGEMAVEPVADAQRLAELVAGESPSQLIERLYPELAALANKGSAEAADALSCLGTTLMPLLGVCVLRATKPAYKAGAAFSLRSRAPVANPTVADIVPPPAAERPKPATAWAALGSGGGGGGDPALIDEDSLLEADDFAKKEAQQMDCGEGGPGGKRKACKNCSCGLKEMIEAEDGQMVEVPTQKSSCGSCALGDAYRCAGCPHLGKPAFAPGEELKLADSMLKGDVQTGVGGPAKVVVGGDAAKTGGVVKLSLDDTTDDF